MDEPCSRGLIPPDHITNHPENSDRSTISVKPKSNLLGAPVLVSRVPRKCSSRDDAIRLTPVFCERNRIVADNDPKACHICCGANRRRSGSNGTRGICTRQYRSNEQQGRQEKQENPLPLCHQLNTFSFEQQHSFCAKKRHKHDSLCLVSYSPEFKSSLPPLNFSTVRLSYDNLVLEIEALDIDNIMEFT